MTTTILREVVNFINSLPDEDSAKILGQFRALEKGWTETLNIKTLKGRIRELIVHDYRIVFFAIKQRIYVVDGFRKKSQKTPPRIIARAEEIHRLIIGMNSTKNGGKTNRRKT